MIKTIFPMTTKYEQNLPFVVKGIGVQDSQDHILRPTGFPDYHWAQCSAGKGMLSIGGNKYEIKDGMGFFFQPNIPHEYYPTEKPWQIHWLTFDGSAVPGLLSYLDLSPWRVVDIVDRQVVKQGLDDIYLSLSSENPDKILESSTLLYSFLANLKNSTICTSGAQSGKPKQLLPIISYMENNYAKYTSVQELADIIGVTSFHLCRLFKQEFQLSPFKYLTRLRIQKAKELLVAFPDMTIQSISEKVGYNTPSYFCRVFKEHEDITPTEFREMHGIV